jgi:hypothetical protein
MMPRCRTKRTYRRLNAHTGVSGSGMPHATDLNLRTHRLKGAKSSKTPPQSPLKTPKSPAVTVPKLWQDGKEQKEDVASKLDFASPHSGGAHV